jgi:hypothetical protein
VKDLQRDPCGGGKITGFEGLGYISDPDTFEVCNPGR